HQKKVHFNSHPNPYVVRKQSDNIVIRHYLLLIAYVLTESSYFSGSKTTRHSFSFPLTPHHMVLQGNQNIQFGLRSLFESATQPRITKIMCEQFHPSDQVQSS